MSDASFEILISAFLDNELGPEERAHAERLIAENAELADLLETMKSHSSRWKSLPRYQLNSQFASRLMATDEFENAFSAATLSQVSTPAAVTLRGKSTSWRAAALAIGSLAALILVTLTLTMDPTQVVTSVAERTSELRTDTENNETGVNAPESDGVSSLKGSGAASADVHDKMGPIVVANPLLQQQQEPATRQLQTLDDRAAGSVRAGLETDDGAQSKEIAKRDAGIALRADDDSLAAPSNKLDESITPKDMIVKNSKQLGFPVVETPSIAPGNKQLLLDENDRVLNFAPAETASMYYADMAPIEQVIDIALTEGDETWEHQFRELRTALAENDIALDNDQSQPSQGDLNQWKTIADEPAGYGFGNSEVLYIETSPIKMRGLISKLAADNTRVRAYNFSTLDFKSPSSNIPRVPEQSNSESFAAGIQPQPTGPPVELKRLTSDQELAIVDQPAAPLLGSVIDQKAAKQPMPEKRNRRSQVEDQVDGQVEDQVDGQVASQFGAVLGGRAAGGQSAAGQSGAIGLNSDPTRSRSFARRLTEKSELTFQSTIELEKQMAREPSKTAEGVDRAGIADGKGRKQAAANSRVEVDSILREANQIGQMREKLSLELSEAELRNIERINRVLGIQPGATDQEQVTRRYLLLVRRARQSVTQTGQVAPAAMDSQAKPADK